MAVCWWVATSLFVLTWNLETTLADGGAFYDFHCVPNDRADDGYQYISPNLTFPCDGVVTKWKIGTEDQDNEQLYLQIWRSTETDYTRVAETVHTHGGGTIAEVVTNMTVSAGDVIGFFIPRPGGEGLRVAWTPVPDHTLLQGMMRSANSESPVATFSGSPTTLSSSPLVSVIFEPNALSCATNGNGCLSAFADFNLVCGKRVADNTQYIIPELNFSCNGTVTQWKVGLEGGGNNERVNLQIWRSVGPGEYTSVTEMAYTKTVGDERIASVPVSMSVMAGDMVGFYVPGGELEPHTLPGVGLTIYTTGGSPTSSLSSLDSVVGPSPYISVVFVPVVTSSSILSMTLAAPHTAASHLASSSIQLSTTEMSSIRHNSIAATSSQLPPANGGDVPSGSGPDTVIGAVVAVVIVLVVGSVMLAALLIAWRLRSRGKKGFTGEVSVGYSSRGGYGTAAVLVGMSSAEDKSVVKRNTYANTDDVALYEVPVLDTTQYEVVLEHTTSANTKAADHCCYEVPVLENDRQYEMVVEHRTENGNAVYEGVGFESSSAASSLFYQYVPSKRSRQQGVRPRDNLEHSAIYGELESVYGSSYTESAYEEIPFTDPAEDVEDIYDQLAHEKCIEIPRVVLKAETALGSGEFGEVFKGTWETPYGPQEVAIKMLKKGATDKSKTTFLKEAAIMAQFRHPHIVRLLGAVTVDEPMMIVLEFLHKGDLRHFLLSLTPDPGTIVDECLPKQLLTFCQEIAEGMRYLSRRGFVHRDLAARNILLSKELSCKIADFGMSKKLDETEYYVTSGGKVPVKWTAPEAIFHKKYSVNSDVWSYGMLMYEIWSLGKKPFSRLSPTELIHILQAETGYIQSPPPGCPKAIYKGMVQCWNLDHHSRPSFSELCSYLKDHSDRGGPSLLEVPLEAVRDPARAAQLGAPLSWAQDLYMDLQQYYL